ncbi:MAG: potassium channel family protein [Phycisphaeraceae bacterium]|nr:potassium channel family protein [Phycisphaeraceae bacterium]
MEDVSCSLLAFSGASAGHIWVVLGIAAAATLGCVGIHYETIRMLVKTLHRKTDRRSRPVLVVTVLVLLAVHLIEAAIYAFAYRLVFLIHPEQPSLLDGPYDGSFGDTLYFSLSVYTTVGFGDIAPLGPVRLLVGIEALAGLVLITWSASFTFLIMQRIFSREFKTE